MPLPLPRSRVTIGVIGACLIACLLLGATLLLTRTAAPGGGASIGGPFALTDQDGRRMTQADMAGHPFIVFFGYTHCPDICPTVLSDMTQMLGRLGTAEGIRALFITIDPERDTPAALKAYLSSFDPRITGLTGDAAAITAAERAYRVYARKVPTSGDDYSMDHTAIVYLMDRDGRFVSALNLDQPPRQRRPRCARICRWALRALRCYSTIIARFF